MKLCLIVFVDIGLDKVHLMLILHAIAQLFFFLSIFILIQNTIFRQLWTMHVIDECICNKIRDSFAILQEIGREQIDSIVSPFFSVRICELKTAF